MHLSLQLWLIDRYTKPGDVILDCMAGSGTILVACSMGRNVICVDLEDKFVKMMEGNWQKIQQRGPQMGYKMGEAVILQGDARNLEGLLADKVIFSPPYADTSIIGVSKGAYSPKRKSYNPDYDDKAKEGYNRDNPDNIGNLPYGDIDAVITSPPFKEQMVDTDWMNKNFPRKHRGKHNPGEQMAENIGNLKGNSYLSEMLKVYKSAYKVLKPQGLLILVLKNFIRDKKEVRLDLDSIKLCEQAGFNLQERHYRKLSALSFWRTIYRNKYPSAPVIDREDVLVFRK